MVRKVAVPLIVAGLGVVSCGCGGDIFVNQQVILPPGGGTTSPGASPTPTAPPACLPAASVRVGFFEFDCPDGSPPASQGILPIGCTGTATATPKERDGSDQNPSLHIGANPTWRVTDGSDHLSLAVLSEPFNVELSWASGTPVGTKAHVEATVCGVTGAFEFLAR